MRLFFNQTSPYARNVRIAIHEPRLDDAVQFAELDPWLEWHDFTAIKFATQPC